MQQQHSKGKKEKQEDNWSDFSHRRTKEIERQVSNLFKMIVYHIVLEIEPFIRQDIMLVSQRSQESEDVKQLRNYFKGLMEYAKKHHDGLDIEPLEFKAIFRSYKYEAFYESLSCTSDPIY